MRTHASEIISRMTMVAILSALGTVLMLMIKFIYPPAPWLVFDFSDTVVLVGYALYGFPGAVSVAVIKTLFDFMVPTSVVVLPIGIGQLSALIASFSYVGCLYLFSHVLHWFRKGAKYRITSYVLTSVMVALFMTFLNIVFITPSYAAQYYTSLFDDSAISKALLLLPKNLSNSYILIMMAIYIPFNLLKALMITTLYEILFNRLIFVMFKDNAFVQKYFIGISFKKEKKEFEPIKNEPRKKPDESLSGDSKALNDLLKKVDKSKENDKNIKK